MLIKKTCSLNPIVWLIQLTLKSVRILQTPKEPPNLVYRNEFWTKKPEQTVKDGYANCVNAAILRYAYLAGAYKGTPGIVYTTQNQQAHAEFAVLGKDLRIVFGLVASSTNPYTHFIFITTEGIYEAGPNAD